MSQQTKPRILDLFCGAIVPHKYLWYNKICVSSVPIAARKQRLNEGLSDFVPLDVSKDSDSANQKNVIANSAGRYSHYSLARIIIGNIVPRRVLKNQSRSIHFYGIKRTLMLWINTIRHALLKILVLGVTSTIMNVLKLSVYWGANV